MKSHNFAQAATAILVLAGSLHLIRTILGWEVVIGGWTVPVWLSWVAIFVTGYLVYHGLELSKKKGKK
jgi:hypothetical protein